MSAKLIAAEKAAIDNADRIFQVAITLTKSDGAAKMLATQITNYGIACFMDGTKYERKRKQKGATE